MANINEGDRLVFVTHLVSKLCYLIRLVSRVQRFVCIFAYKNHPLFYKSTERTLGGIVLFTEMLVF